MIEAEVAEAANVLARLGLVTAYGHVSARAGEVMLITRPRTWPASRRPR